MSIPITFQLPPEMLPAPGLLKAPGRNFLPLHRGLESLAYRKAASEVIVQHLSGIGFHFSFFQVHGADSYSGNLHLPEKGFVVFFGLNGNVNFGFKDIDYAVHALQQMQVSVAVPAGDHHFFIQHGIHRFYMAWFSEAWMSLAEKTLPDLDYLRTPIHLRADGLEIPYCLYTQKDSNIFSRLARTGYSHLKLHVFYQQQLLQLMALYEPRLKQFTQHTGHPTEEIYLRAVDHIRAHYLDPGLDLPAIALASNVSVSGLVKALRRRGFKAHLFINDLRMAKARELLGQSDLSFGEIATYVGCHDPSHFTKLFKKTYLRTPKEYRKDLLW